MNKKFVYQFGNDIECYCVSSFSHSRKHEFPNICVISFLQFYLLLSTVCVIDHMHPEGHAPVFLLMCLFQSIFTLNCIQEH